MSYRELRRATGCPLVVPSRIRDWPRIAYWRRRTSIRASPPGLRGQSQMPRRCRTEAVLTSRRWSITTRPGFPRPPKPKSMRTIALGSIFLRMSLLRLPASPAIEAPERDYPFGAAGRETATTVVSIPVAAFRFLPGPIGYKQTGIERIRTGIENVENEGVVGRPVFWQTPGAEVSSVILGIGIETDLQRMAALERGGRT